MRKEVSNVFNIHQFITTKKEGNNHLKGDITTFIEKFMTHEVTDSQMSAWLMAVSIEGLSFKELVELTEAMIHSGEVMQWPENMNLVDKHSTGGVGDKTTLIVSPIVASLGIPMVKLSGRGLGHTGGTIDKLLSIPHINLEKSIEEILAQVKAHHLYLGAQTSNLVPADKRMYALRDETATINHIGLIAASILSKKIATGAKSFVFDVKVGVGAFMKNLDEARELAMALVELGKYFGKKVSVVLSDMNEPLGKAIGNQLEVIESIDILKNAPYCDKNLKVLSLTLAALCILNSDYDCDDYKTAYQLAEGQLANGQAYRTFMQVIEAQSGNLREMMFDEAEFTCDFYSTSNGIISQLNALTYGEMSHRLGAGQVSVDHTIYPTAGILLNKKVGDEVFVGENIARLYYNIERSDFLKEALKELDQATLTSETEVTRTSIVLDIIQ